ncbi:MAG: SPFH domain-containing protein, partial [Chloroflexota bacterium]
MEEALPQLAALALAATIMAAWIGSRLDRFGVVMLGAPAAFFSVVCIAAGLLWGWPAALAAVLVVEIIAIWGGKNIFQSSGVKSIGVLWLWYAAIGALVYLNKTWFGLIAIALPAFVILWGGLFLFSGSILPVKGAEQRMQAFRSLLTFTLGTNFPYFIIQDWKKEEKPIPRVDGNPYSRYLSGPGIVLTSCDHLVVTTTRLKSNLVQSPGLTFTGKYEEIQAVVDLRPQLRAFTVQAETQDGIPIKIFSFWPCKIDSGRRQPGWKESYPYNKESVFRAVYQQPQGHKWDQDETGRIHEELKKIDWDDLLPKTIAPPIIKKIILDYTCDQLCAPGNPREEIKQRIRKQLEDALRPLGIQVVGGG